MTGLPVNVVNLICEWAAQEDIDWYPFFCPKTYNLSWKVNKYSRKFNLIGDVFMRTKFTHPFIECEIHLFNMSTLDTYTSSCKVIFLEIFGGRDSQYELYIQFDSENNPEKQDKFIYRSKLYFQPSGNDLDFMNWKTQYLYLNGTQYGIINDCNIDTTDFRMNMTIELF